MGENLEVCFQIFMDNWKYEIGEIKIDEFLRNITIFIRHFYNLQHTILQTIFSGINQHG